MIKLNQKGNAGVISAVLFLIFFTMLLVVRFSGSEQVVSGVVYNTKNNRVFTGKTTFSVRASEDTFVSEENRSSYCLPPGSPYIDLVNRAAEDKDIKVIVRTEKYIKFAAPWTCIDNVTVEEQ